jgi:toxin ParE1/3/4
MTAGFKITKAAVKDLEDIWTFTKKTWTEKQADRYYQLIIDEIQFNVKKPYLGSQYEQIRAGYRGSKVKSHLIFYKLNNNQVEIIRILHVRMNLLDHLVDA